MIYRDYQHKYINNIQLDKSNLVISTMGSGKTLILKGVIDKYFSDKKVLILTNRRGLTIQLSEAFPNSTFILAGKEHDTTHNIHLTTSQTFQRRDYNLEDYALVCVDEIHETYNIKTVKEIRELSCTRVYLTGTPINSRGKFLGKFDNVLEFTNMKQMLEDDYLASTRFMSKANILSNEADIGVQNGEYKSDGVERVIDKQAIIQWLVKDNLEYKWDTEHKCIMYVSSIAVATKIVRAFNRPDTIKVIHSKLSKKELEETDTWFKKSTNSILVNVRMYTTGTDIPSVDTIINVSPTKILSLYLQSIWRGSRVHPEGRETIVYDYSGNLMKEGFNPFYNDWYKKPKPSCLEQCKKAFEPNTMDLFMCLKSCLPNPDSFLVCDDKPSYSFEENEFKTNFEVIGKPCKIAEPFWKYIYTQETPEGTLGLIRKTMECPNCGTKKIYNLHTITQPSTIIEMYKNEVETNNLTFIYNKKVGIGLLIIDDLTAKNYRYKTIKSQMELYEFALKTFKGKKFTISSNIPLTKLENVGVDKKLDDLIDLIDWTKEDQKIMRKVITQRLYKKVKDYSMAKGYVYYFKKVIKESNERFVMKALDKVYDKYDLMKLKKKLEKN